MSTTVDSAKASLRQKVGNRLKSMLPQQIAAASVKICGRMRQQAIWRSAGSILFFAPMPGEPDIWPLLEDALQADKIVGLPRFSPAANTYLAARIRNPDKELHRGHIGIREPTKTCAELLLSQFDLVLVPGVAFDTHGRRLGRGKGYYDRLLANVLGVKGGVALDEQIVDAVPMGPSDVHLDFILTPTRWLEAKQEDSRHAKTKG